MRFAGRRAVVTGGLSGIGEAVAKRISAEGGRVVVWDMQGGIKTDIADYDSVQSAAAETLKQLGGIDILVNSAGIAGPTATVTDLKLEDWHRTIAINLNGTFYTNRAVVPHMIERGSGKIVLMSSRSYLGNIGQVNYSTAKAGIIGFTSSLAREMARHQINVNCVVPGFIDNPRLATMAEKYRQMRIEMNPFQTVGEAGDVANAILFLASDEAAQVTGQALHVASW